MANVLVPVMTGTVSARTMAHPLLGAAMHLSTLAAGAHPLISPGVPPPAGVTQAQVKVIAADPGLSAVALGAATPTPSAAATGATNPDGSPVTAVTTDNGSFNPADFKRLPKRRHMLMGMAPLVFGGAGAAKGIMAPQLAAKPNHLCFPSNTLAGTLIDTVLVGAFPQSVNASADDAAEFYETSTGGMWDMDLCEIGQEITMNVTVTGATTVYAAVTCEVYDQKAYSLPRSALKRVGLGATVVGAGATTTIGGAQGILPQTGFKTRKVILNAAVAGLVVNSIQVGIAPCFLSGDPVPAVMMSELGQFLWFDWDEAKVGNGIFIKVFNPTGGNLTFSGGLLGDINPGDATKPGAR